MILKKLGSFNSHVSYKILRSHSPKEFFIALAIGLLLKSNTASRNDSVYWFRLTCPSIHPSVDRPNCVQSVISPWFEASISNLVHTSPITWANVDPDLSHHMTWLGHNDLNWLILPISINVISLSPGQIYIAPVLEAATRNMVQWLTQINKKTIDIHIQLIFDILYYKSERTFQLSYWNSI